jgi:hypothetical protein
LRTVKRNPTNVNTFGAIHFGHHCKTTKIPKKKKQVYERIQNMLQLNITPTPLEPTHSPVYLLKHFSSL